MKIDKSNPLHWIWLGLFSINTCLALFLRLFIPAAKRNTAILYGHKLNGNLKGIHDYTRQQSHPLADNLYYLTMDPAYYKALQKQGTKGILCGLNPLHMIKLARAFAIISDHGLHSLILLLKLSNIRFIDVWHGIPFKGFDSNDFALQHQYDEIWVASRRLADLYCTQFGFRPEQLYVTGYARTDILVNKDSNIALIKKQLGIHSQDQKIILFAPTWQQDEQQRNIYPFGIEEVDFLKALNDFSRKHNTICLLRKHLNSRTGSLPALLNIIDVSYQQFPDAESVLLISDLLVCDWSSIAFDYLLMDRPTVFLDVPPPFKKGFSLDQGYRYGEIAGSMQALLAALHTGIETPHQYWLKHRENHTAIKQEIYADIADGRAAERCMKRLATMN